MASASTSDHQPMPMQATRSGSVICMLIFQLAPIASTASRAMRSSVAQSPPLTPMPPMHSPSTRTGAPPSIAVQRSGPAASARPSAWVTSRSWPTAPLADGDALVGGGAHRLGGARNARCGSARRPCARARSGGRRRRRPRTEIAIPASRALAMAVAIIFFAPSWVRRLASAMYMGTCVMGYRWRNCALAGPGGQGGEWPELAMISMLW